VSFCLVATCLSRSWISWNIAEVISAAIRKAFLKNQIESLCRRVSQFPSVAHFKRVLESWDVSWNRWSCYSSNIEWLMAVRTTHLAVGRDSVWKIEQSLQQHNGRYLSSAPAFLCDVPPPPEIDDWNHYNDYNRQWYESDIEWMSQKPRD
jgi:hypothetical protein